MYGGSGTPTATARDDHRRPRKETSMSKVLQRGTAILAVIASLVFATAALAQMPTIALEEGGTVPGTGRRALRRRRQREAVRDWRLGRRQSSGRHLRVRPGHRQMDQEKVDAAAGPPCGPGRCERQDLRDRGLRRPAGHHDPRRRRMGTHRRRVGVRSGRRFLEDAGAAARQARGRGGRRGRRQDLRDRRRHDGGSVQGPVLHVLRTVLAFSPPTTCTTRPRTSGRAAGR